MKFHAAAYITKEDQGTWNVEKKQEVKTEDKKLDKNKFPHLGTSLSGVQVDSLKTYWGFIRSDADFDNTEAVVDAKRKESAEDKFRGYWTGQDGGSTTKAHEGSSKGNDGCTEMFGNDTLKIKEAVDGVTGKGVDKKIDIKTS